MAEIIPLRPGARAARPAPPPAEGAQILFFLGVRYCRIEEEPEEPQQPASTPRGEDDGGKKRRPRRRA